jgi:anti-sigma factor RsiW
MTEFSEEELESYLDEALAASRMAVIEAELRSSPTLGQRLAAINARRDAGQHTLGEIWRSRRLSCPSRDELGSYLLGVLDDDAASYIEFHTSEVGCRYCQANLADLRARQSEAAAEAQTRRRKYFQSSAGYLRQR